jgi:hypothetical protein
VANGRVQIFWNTNHGDRSECTYPARPIRNAGRNLSTGAQKLIPEITFVISGKLKLGHWRRRYQRLEFVRGSVILPPKGYAQRIWVARFRKLCPVANHVFGKFFLSFV